RGAGSRRGAAARLRSALESGAMRWACPRVIRGNRGDLASRWGILASLAELGLRDFEIFCADPRHVPRSIGARLHPYGRVYNLLPNWKGWRALARCDGVLWTGGLDLQDDSSIAKLAHTLVLFSLYRLLGLRIVVAMQGAGPLETRIGRCLARCILRLVDRFLVRDQGSLRLLRGLTGADRLVLAQDGIFLPGFGCEPIPPAESAEIEAMTARASGQKLIGINLRLWFHFTGGLLPYQLAKRRYQARAAGKMAEFVAAAERLVQELRRSIGARILLISMYEPGVEPWEDDLPFLRQLKAAFRDDDEVVLAAGVLGIPAFFELLSRLDLMVGTRLHSALIALRGGRPAIHLSYTLKGPAIFAQLGLCDWVVNLPDFIAAPEEAASLAQRILADSDSRRRVASAVAAAIAANRAVLAECVAGLDAASPA
ncbi:MAG TPA: polysaccharide pyruvyl transferase family protein, partial [Stellaceae bacterium]|nr:polysaccharide pyruvyl transferase family protein [Stellaceae bacterium]